MSKKVAKSVFELEKSKPKHNRIQLLQRHTNHHTNPQPTHQYLNHHTQQPHTITSNFANQTNHCISAKLIHNNNYHIFVLTVTVQFAPNVQYMVFIVSMKYKQQERL